MWYFLPLLEGRRSLCPIFPRPPSIPAPNKLHAGYLEIEEGILAAQWGRFLSFDRIGCFKGLSSIFFLFHQIMRITRILEAPYQFF